jgi:hypothetical protein
MTQAQFGQDGRARVVAGAPAIVALQLLEADGTTPQALAGRVFVYSVWRSGDGSVVGDFEGDGDDAVVEDGATVVKLGPVGAETAAWDLGPMRRADYAWAIYERTTDGDVIWFPLDGRPGLYQVTGARDPDADWPAGPGPALEGPYAVIALAGVAGGASVAGVSAMGSPGLPAPVVTQTYGEGFLATGATTVTLANAASDAKRVELYIDSIRQRPGVDYTADGGTTLTLQFTVDAPGIAAWWLHSH